MSQENIKMTDDEIAEIKILQDKFQKKIFQLGQLYLKKLQTESVVKSLNEEELKLGNEWKILQKTESELIDKLLNKYGEGSLDLSNGIFISEKKSP